MITQINKDFLEARKNNDNTKKTFLSVLKGEIELAKSRGNFDENSVNQIIKKMEKSLLNAINNGDKSAKIELEYLKPYLPKMMSKDDITIIVKELIQNGANNIGMVMKEFNTKYKGKADNNIVKQVYLSI